MSHEIRGTLMRVIGNELQNRHIVAIDPKRIVEVMDNKMARHEETKHDAIKWPPLEGHLPIVPVEHPEPYDELPRSFMIR